MKKGLSKRRLLLVTFFNVIITIVEYVAGVLSGSLALLSDAGHNLSDVLALLLGYAGEKVSEWKPGARFSFGLRRFEILVALVNALALLGIGGVIVRAAIVRFLHPVNIDTGILIPVALVGLFGNAFSILVLHRDRERSLNLKAAFLHLLFDTMSSVGVVLVGVVILFKPWYWLDLAISIGIVVMMVWSTWGVISQSLRVFMQAVPDRIDPERVRAAVLGLVGVNGMHGLHIWSVDSNEIFLSCHVCINRDAATTDTMIRKVNSLLAAEFNIRHTTIQIELDDLCGQEGARTGCP
ncbi:MAG: cation transporter [Myxococcales bacterium]|nr:cation transporter [Myxococcales bacterium]